MPAVPYLPVREAMKSTVPSPYMDIDIRPTNALAENAGAPGVRSNTRYGLRLAAELPGLRSSCRASTRVIALTSRDEVTVDVMRSLPRFVRVPAIGAVLVVAIAVAGWTFNGRPATVSQDVGGQASTGPSPVTASTRSPFRGIILPDLLLVRPAGLTHTHIARLHAIGGERKLTAFDGGPVTVDRPPPSAT